MRCWLISIVAIWICSADAYAQARISARLDTNIVHIGAPFRMYVVLRLPASARLYTPSAPDNDSTIAFLDTLRSSTIVRDEEQIVTQVWQVMAFDSGQLVLPPLPYIYGSGNRREDTLFTPALRVRALPLLVDAKKIKMLAPIIEEPFWWSDLKTLYIALGLLLAFYAIYWYRRRRVQESLLLPTIAPLLPTIAPEKWAYQALAELEERQLLEKSNTESRPNTFYAAHYTALSIILKTYIERRYQAQVADKTSAEIAEFIQPYIEKNTPLMAQMHYFLPTIDLIKFAKMKVNPSKDTELWQIVHFFIEYTTPAPVSEIPTNEQAKDF